MTENDYKFLSVEFEKLATECEFLLGDRLNKELMTLELYNEHMLRIEVLREFINNKKKEDNNARKEKRE
ncbi:hypothetical protein [Acidovorax sp. NCPPB 3576]|uniref:hypothetical protein n=1 Tax=Acidovorax sp. NCPPB 3576 TaxID=2940488 RepID=UPI00234A8136|nr:hypothetical protein [Acidovorax sp. NCPPB 3576]WCM90658.1 hypothetical protein M5C98_11850 [Acidovorax sp. NCPPB 3576]